MQAYKYVDVILPAKPIQCNYQLGVYYGSRKRCTLDPGLHGLCALCRLNGRDSCMEQGVFMRQLSPTMYCICFG